MKSKFLLPAVTAVLGFTLAWVAKPGNPAATAARQVEESPAKRLPRAESGVTSPSGDNKRPKDVKASDFPLADAADKGPKTRDEARMLRLTEALGLSIDQQGDIIKLIEDVQAAMDGNVPVLQDLATRGKAIEEGLTKLLSPEQLAKFQELRVRERENRVESRAQKMILGAIEDIDLSPEQREEVLKRLRLRAKNEMQAIPDAATLLLDKSMLPTNNKELSMDGILLLTKIDEDGAPSENPAQAHQKVLDSQRRDLEETLNCFDGILSSGQMGQYQASLAEARAILEKIPKMRGEARATPEPVPPVTVERVPVPDENEAMSAEDEEEIKKAEEMGDEEQPDEEL
ncbi:hypothetical protein JIN84_01765 [Luteolibacter yonseiensis]|uniref:Uncharacterized protein n=1 Tax=Luteolibacter yonseiensis TaxID=1144680 RepID=A0A934R2I1_9BACT|nr:hypothetical protein [Luteolibacter yonseiensis]MBK1814320.1 hypothetical protein [Luteolibacter yonseiensis]